MTCLLLASALLAASLPACRRTPDEVQIREAIAAIEQAAENGAASDVGASLSEDFDGNASELDRRRLTGMVRLLALRGEHIGVTMGPVSIEHRGARMLATFTVTLTSGGSGAWLPDRAQVYQVHTGWRRDGDDWLLLSAQWKPTL